MTNTLKLGGRIFYGIGVIGIGNLHFIYPGFLPFILPIPAESTKDLHFLGIISCADRLRPGDLYRFQTPIDWNIVRCDALALVDCFTYSENYRCAANR